MENVDFVIPLKQNNIIIRTVIEGIISFYSPRNVYIITDPSSILEINENHKNWKIENTEIKCVDENIFSKNDLERRYTFIDEKSREFGWWFQQIIKLDAVNKINTLSDPFIVWDADLIPLIKWDLYDLETREYKFAILQKSAKNQFNHDQYLQSIREMIDLDIQEPYIGTFVPHHFVFYHNVIKSLLHKIDPDNWQNKIIESSKKYYRFSEYKCVATYMQHFFPHLFKYYDYKDFGEKGIRFRESLEIQEKIKTACIIDEYGLSYNVFKDFVKKEFPLKKEITYIQIEHVL
jgi:hypothetical protein